jgi:hypothetical protein
MEIMLDNRSDLFACIKTYIDKKGQCLPCRSVSVEQETSRRRGRLHACIGPVVLSGAVNDC